jgi:hypothetical protein
MDQLLAGRQTSKGGSFLTLLDVPHLGRQIVATQRDAEQEAHPGHDPIAVADAGGLARSGDLSRRVAPKVSGRKFPFPELLCAKSWCGAIASGHSRQTSARREPISRRAIRATGGGPISAVSAICADIG